MQRFRQQWSTQTNNTPGEDSRDIGEGLFISLPDVWQTRILFLVRQHQPFPCRQFQHFTWQHPETVYRAGNPGPARHQSWGRNVHRDQAMAVIRLKSNKWLLHSAGVRADLPSRRFGCQVCGCRWSIVNHGEKHDNLTRCPKIQTC